MSDDRPMLCLECDETVDFCESERGTLVVTCGCDKRRSVKVAQTLPEGWA